MTKLEKEIAKAAPVTRKRGQSEQDFFRAQAEYILEDMEDNQWDALSDAVKKWANVVGVSCRNGFPIPSPRDFDADDYPDDEKDIIKHLKAVHSSKEPEPEVGNAPPLAATNDADEDFVDEEAETEPEQQAAEPDDEPDAPEAEQEQQEPEPVAAKKAQPPKQQRSEKKMRTQTQAADTGRNSRRPPRREPAKAASRKATAASRGNGHGGNKTEIVASLLKRKSGTTRADILKATGWPSVSVQAMAKASGLKLRKQKTKGEPTTYFGS